MTLFEVLFAIVFRITLFLVVLYVGVWIYSLFGLPKLDEPKQPKDGAK